MKFNKNMKRLIAFVVLSVLMLMGIVLALTSTHSQAAFASHAPAVPPNDPTISYGFAPVITQGLANPVFVTHAKDDRLFIVEQAGRIRIYKNNALTTTSFLDIDPVVRCCGEEGLLGLAFEPNYANTGRFYVYYTNNNGDENIARYTVSLTDTNIADPLSATILMTIPHPTNGNHNGGWLGFGPDNLLYAGTGDGGSGGDPNCNGQNPNTWLGKMLRLNVVGQITYTAPASNTFTTTQQAEVWAIGLRNPWRNSFDRQTGEFYIADVGQNAWEEVNHVPANASAGLNFGWNGYEGNHSYSTACTWSNIAATFPVTEYVHVGFASVTGGYVYRGSSYPWLQGDYFFADEAQGNIWAMWQPSPGVFSTTQIADNNWNVSSFGEDSAGELYVADYGSNTIYRLTSAQGTPATPTPTKTPTPEPTSTRASTGLPDLQITNMSISFLLGANGCYSETTLGTYVNFRNGGDAHAGAFTVTLNGISQRVPSGLNIGESGQLWFNSGQTNATAEIDAGHEIAESNEANNTLSQMLPIPTQPLPCKTATPTFTPTPGPITRRAYLPVVLKEFSLPPLNTPTPTSSPTLTPTATASPRLTTTSTSTPMPPKGSPTVPSTSSGTG